jgi:hypothetical protein
MTGVRGRHGGELIPRQLVDRVRVIFSEFTVAGGCFRPLSCMNKRLRPNTQ